MSGNRRSLVIGAVTVLIVSSLAAGGVASAALNASHRGYVQVPGSAYVLQPGDVDEGRLPNAQVRFELALNLRHRKVAEGLARAVSDPASPTYGQYLSPALYRKLFAPSDVQAKIITGWLSGAGMNITYNPANHLMIAAAGPVAAADRTFQTDIHLIQDKDGNTFEAPLTPLYVPRAAAGIVDGFVEGINNPSRLAQPLNTEGTDGSDASPGTPDAAHTSGDFTPVTPSAPPPAGFRNAGPCSTYFGEKAAMTPPLTPDYVVPVSYAPCGYKPAQLEGAYGVSSLLQAGVDGSGVTVAITDAYASPTIVGDINQYVANDGGALWDDKFSQVVPSSVRYGYDDKVNGNVCREQGWYGEETLDVEAVHAMAPAANVLYVGASSCADQDLLGSVNDIVDQHHADIITNSWGGSNETLAPVLLDVYNTVFVQAAIEGIGVFYSSGDSGDETDSAGGVRTVDFPASDPWVTAVGGTSLGVDQNNGYIGEVGWGTAKDTVNPDGTWALPLPGAHLYGAGGGTSQLFAQPWYQRNVVPSVIANYFGGAPGRAVPDIGAVADPNTGMLVGQTQTFPEGAHYDEYRIGGTSLASPLMAGIEALADQVAGHPHGFANPAIYQLRPDALHDVVQPPGAEAVLRVDYVDGVDAAKGTVSSLRTFNQTETIFTRPGYDDVTGVGTPIAPVYAAMLGTTSDV